MADGGEIVSFPDEREFPDDPAMKDPFKHRAKTDEGTVRPAVVVALLNRNMRRKLEKELGKRARERNLPEPVIMRKPLSEAETTDKMASMILDEWEKYHKYFPLATLQQFLDERTGRIMEQAYLTGKPIDREAVRQAIGALWDRSKKQAQ